MRHLRCPQRFHPGLEGGELFPPGHDVSRRAWSSFGCSSFSSSLAVPSHSPSRAAATAATAAAAGPSAAARQRYGHAVPCGTPSPQWLAPCPRAARTRGAVGHLQRRSRCTAGELGERGHGQIRQAPSADTRADLLPLREAPPPPAGRHRPARQVPPAAGGRHSRRAVRQGDVVEQHRPAERDDPDEAPGPPVPALPGPERHQMVRRSRNKTDPLPLSRWAR
jgi:hypothetical protein